jgi:hypothetical protein
MHVSLSVLLLPLCRSNAVVHVIRLVLWHLHTYKSEAVGLRDLCLLSVRKPDPELLISKHLTSIGAAAGMDLEEPCVA